MKCITLAPCINLYADAFSADDARSFMTMLDMETKDAWSELEWRDSSVGSGVVSSIRTSISCSLIPLFPPYPPTDVSSFFHEKIFSHWKDVVEDYQHEHQLSNNFHEVVSVLRYTYGAEYHLHHDHFRDNQRVFSVVAFLNTPDGGGELEFPVFDVSIKPTAGSIVVFPSNFPYQHIAHPVTSGVKESLVSWYS